jgi:hypothetical protein
MSDAPIGAFVNTTRFLPHEQVRENRRVFRSYYALKAVYTAFLFALASWHF